MRRLLCEYALVNGIWRRRVAIDVAADGSIAAVEPAAPHDDGERLAGFVLPGLIDAHSHAAVRLVAGLMPQTPIAPMTRRAAQLHNHLLSRLGPEELYAVAAALYVELLLAGCTSVVAFHDLHHAADGTPYADPGLMAFALHEAAREAGIGLTLLIAGRLVGGWDGGPLEGPQRRSFLTPDRLARILERLQNQFGDDPRCRIGLGIPTLAAVPVDRVGELLQALDAIDPHAPIHLQLAADSSDPKRCRARYGFGPLSLLARRVGLNARWCFVHLEALDAEEWMRLADSEAVGVLLAGEVEGRCAALAEPLRRLTRIAIGSGGGAVPEPARWLRDLCQIEQASYGPGQAVDRAGLLCRVAVGGAQASGRALGRLAPGFRADLLHLDPHHPLFAGATPDDVLAIWLFANSRRAFVRDVMVGGVWQVRDGCHVAEERVFAGFRQTRGRILGDLP